MKENSIFIDMPMTGVCTLDMHKVLKKWGKLWSLAEWRSDNSWRIVKHKRKDSAITEIKATISEEDAQEIIEKLNLIGVNTFGASGYTYRKKEHWN